MDLFAFNPEAVFDFLLLLIRISMLVFLLPFFGGAGLPRTVKAAFCLVLTVALWPSLSFEHVSLPANLWEILLMLLGELFLGLTLGLMVRIVFAAVQTAGQIMGFQMGFAMMNVVDPMSGVSVTLTSQFLYLVTLLLFLSMNGHLYLLSGLTQSVYLVPPGKLLLNGKIAEQVFNFSSQIFVLGVKIAAPVMAAELLVSISLGIVARMAPQMNVLFVGFPLKIAIGFIFLGIVLTLLHMQLRQFIGQIPPLFKNLMQAGGVG